VGEIRKGQWCRVAGNSKTAGEEVLSVGYLSRQFKVGHFESEGVDCVEGQISQGWVAVNTHYTRKPLDVPRITRGAVQYLDAGPDRQRIETCNLTRWPQPCDVETAAAEDRRERWEGP
jgi:hypothetical protein